MDRAQRVLMGLLAAQLVLLAILHNPFARARASGGDTLLPTLASITPERIEIGGGDGATLALERRSGAWVLGQPAGYPVAPGKVEKVIQDLEHLSVGRPVASDKSSHAALKVATDQYERRLRIWAKPGGSPVAELYLGTSAGAGATHARVGGNDRVLEESGLSAWDVPADAGSWIERNLVSFRPEDVTRLELRNRKGAFALEKREGVWHVQAPAGRVSAALDSVKVLDLVRSVCGMTIDQPAGPLDESAQGFGDPEATVTLATGMAGGSGATPAPASVTVRIGGVVAGKADSRYAARSGFGFAATVQKFAFDRALEAKLEELTKKK